VLRFISSVVECLTVIASEAKQSPKPEQWGLLRRCTPRNDVSGPRRSDAELAEQSNQPDLIVRRSLSHRGSRMHASGALSRLEPRRKDAPHSKPLEGREAAHMGGGIRKR
jgi:hypothetical protein